MTSERRLTLKAVLEFTNVIAADFDIILDGKIPEKFIRNYAHRDERRIEPEVATPVIPDTITGNPARKPISDEQKNDIMNALQIVDGEHTKEDSVNTYFIMANDANVKSEYESMSFYDKTKYKTVIWICYQLKNLNKKISVREVASLVSVRNQLANQIVKKFKNVYNYY